MDSNRIKGRVERAGGSIKEKLSKASGDKSLELEGRSSQTDVAFKKAFGKAMDAPRKG